MKRILGAAVAAVVLATGVGLAAPSSATAAVPSNVVTSSEFYKVTQGNSIAYVRKVFGNNGKVTHRSDSPGTRYDYLSVDFPTYYDNGWVTVDFNRRSNGTWYLDTKSAYWASPIARTADKATESEFYRVKQGNSIDYTRRTFGTAGTIESYYDGPGSSSDAVTVSWPTVSPYGWVTVDFVKSTSGGWKVDSRHGYWTSDPKPSTDKATSAEVNRVRTGNSLDYVRATFGTAGTVGSYSDSPGTAFDSLTLLWPTSSPYGWVTVNLDKRSSGAWKVESVDAYWG